MKKEFIENQYYFYDKNYINKYGFDEISLLFFAAKFNQIFLVKQLLHDDININITDNLGATPLFLAVQQANIEIMNLLLQQPTVDVNLSSLSETPLFIAVKNDNLEAINLLLQHPNVDINITNKSKSTPLFEAVKNGNVEIVKLLLQKKQYRR